MKAATLMLALLGALTAPLSHAAGIDFRSATEINGLTVHLADVADLSALPAEFREQARGVVLGELRHMQDHGTQIDAAWLASRARAQMPALAGFIQVQPGQSVAIHVKMPTTPAPVAPRSCWQLRHAVTAAAAVIADDLTEAPCPHDEAFGRVGYDPRQHVARYLETLPAGAWLAPMTTAAFASVEQGQPLDVVVKIGNVTLRRQVIAAQSAPAGAAVFVQTREGDVLSANLPKGFE